LELISKHYGAQAVVVSIDPKRIYVESPDKASDKNVCKLRDYDQGPNGEKYCWWAVTVKGGRETKDMDAVELARVSEILGAGEIMLNCIDMDGQGQGYDIPLINAVQKAVTVPVIASSGCGKAEHFSQVFNESNVNAALAAGIFHRNEVRIQDVKAHLIETNIPCRK
jgi:glutamine amidotransferase/cyclase